LKESERAGTVMPCAHCHLVVAVYTANEFVNEVALSI